MMLTKLCTAHFLKQMMFVFHPNQINFENKYLLFLHILFMFEEVNGSAIICKFCIHFFFPLHAVLVFFCFAPCIFVNVIFLSFTLKI